MEPTASDPAVQQQYGMTVGIPNAGQVRALGMINIRGERSVTCKGDFDKHPVGGSAAAGRADGVRGVPPPAGRAGARRGARRAVRPQSGSRGDADVLHPVLVQGPVRHEGHALHRRRRRALRHRFPGPRSYARRAAAATKAPSSTPRPTPPNTTAAGPAIPAGRISRPNSCRRRLAISAAPGPAIPCNSYDTTRAASIGSSSGSGVSVSTNLVMCSLCEETGQSCRGPANHNSVALILPHKAHLSFLGGAIGAEIYNDRAGIHCRNISDAARVLDALKDPVDGYYDPRDIFTTVPRSSLPTEPYAQRGHRAAAPGALKGMRIGIIREFMVKHAKVDEPIVDAAAAEMKDDAGRPSRRHAGRVGDARLGRRSRHREHDDDVRSRDRGAGAGALSRFALPAERGQRAGLSGLRRQGEADPVRARA